MGSRTARGPVLPHSGCAFEGRGKETDSDVSRARYPGCPGTTAGLKVKTAPCRGGERAGPVLRTCPARPPCVGTSLPCLRSRPAEQRPRPPGACGVGLWTPFRPHLEADLARCGRALAFAAQVVPRVTAPALSPPSGKDTPVRRGATGLPACTPAAGLAGRSPLGVSVVIKEVSRGGHGARSRDRDPRGEPVPGVYRQGRRRSWKGGEAPGLAERADVTDLESVRTWWGLGKSRPGAGELHTPALNSLPRSAVSPSAATQTIPQPGLF